MSKVRTGPKYIKNNCTVDRLTFSHFFSLEWTSPHICVWFLAFLSILKILHKGGYQEAEHHILFSFHSSKSLKTRNRGSREPGGNIHPWSKEKGSNIWHMEQVCGEYVDTEASPGSYLSKLPTPPSGSLALGANRLLVPLACRPLGIPQDCSLACQGMGTLCFLSVPGRQYLTFPKGVFLAN